MATFIGIAIYYTYNEFFKLTKDEILFFDLMIFLPLICNIVLSIKSICAYKEMVMKSAAIESIKFSGNTASMYDGG